MRSSATFTRRLIAAATSAALVGAGLVALGHQVEERHEVCAEHGELIHTGPGGPVVAGERGDSVGDNPLDLDHGDHCAIAWTAPDAPERAAAVTAVAPLADRAGPAPLLERRRSAALYRLAPKTSPPA